MVYLKKPTVPEGALYGMTIKKGKDKIVEITKESQEGSARYYSEMLLRQHPWLRGVLQGQEYPIAFSYRKPENLLGLSLAFVGMFVVTDTVLHLTRFDSILLGALFMLVGCILLYAAFWAMCFAKRAYILVTSERVVYQKMNLLGKPGRAIAVARNDISRVRFLKSTVMYRMGRHDGGISIQMKNGRSIFVSGVCDGENIFGALR